MTRTAKAWREVALRAVRNSDKAEDTAARYDAIAQKHDLLEDVLVADVYREAGYRALHDADWWRQQAALFYSYAEDAAAHEAPLTDAGYIDVETVVVSCLLTVCAFWLPLVVWLGPL
ncbi:MAG: hypothetical protein JWO69_2045 [Thermoleophilia bacterium]|nr:hypothetical protein [Thermoleophilia bacterium]